MSEANCFDDNNGVPLEESLLTGLNPEQRRAVCHDEGPLLILAGAGSGKTRVITIRISYLVRVRHVRPSAILAITFTNKAAAEMKERIRDLVGEMASYMWVGTFHSMFARILRRHADLLQFEKNFAILDSDDQQKIIKECISDLNLNDKIFVPRAVHAEISKAKNELISPEDFEREAGPDYRRQKIAAIYRKYQEKLRASNGMDFDDILYFAVVLLKRNPEVLNFYQEQFKYILVDEYQDTNHAQYILILMLAKKYRNLCVVGDDDQSIYSFRGANIRNILDFEKDFKDTTVIKLEQNYRSTSNILEAANTVIRNNRGRKAKKLWTEFDPGEKITYYCADHHGAEAYYVTDQIQKLVKAKKFKYGDMAVLYRLNALSRTIESAFRDQGIPYRVYGGQRFYDRKEIKDILAYLRLIMSPSDNYAFDRIINVPKRGIGDTTVDRVKELAVESGMSYLQVCAQAPQYPELARASHKLQQFSYMLDAFRQKILENSMSFSEYIEYVQDQSGIMQEIIEQKEKKGETVDRIENLRELLSEAVEFEARRKGQAEEKDTLDQEMGGDALSDAYSHEDTTYDTDLKGLLQSYLENAALYSEGDNEGTDDDFVRLLTIHSAKGLEFGVVFLIGTEEGIFPGTRSMDNEEAIEEERRLAYVAITRARKKLHITSARSRMLFGQTQEMPPSRFIREIDPAYLESIGASRRSFVDDGPSARTAPSASSVSPGAAGYTAGLHPFGTTAFGAPRPAPAGSAAVGDDSWLTPETISKGMTVRHPRFGKGTVVSVEKVAGDALVCVAFENKTTRNMLVRQAKLVKC
ncbi:MAG: UvrD-helicase domain-containing protein [Eubacteriales bacterium]